MTHTFKFWPRKCACGWSGKLCGWSYQMPLACPECGAATEVPGGPQRSHGIVPDDIPGGMWIRDGICNEDGTPKKYYTRSSIDRALFEKGLFRQGETPKYRRD